MLGFDLEQLSTCILFILTSCCAANGVSSVALFENFLVVRPENIGFKVICFSTCIL